MDESKSDKATEIAISNGDLRYLGIKTAVALIDYYLAALNSVKIVSDKERLTLLVAASTEYLKHQSSDGEATRPLHYLRKYLTGNDETEIVELHQLLSEDKGVMKRVISKINTYLAQSEIYKSSGIDFSTSGRFEKAKKIGALHADEAYRTKSTGQQTKSLDIDIEQDAYEVADWKNSIGSFNLNWKIINVRVDKSGGIVQLSGRNRYRWHPDVPRSSQRVHIAAEKLKEYGAKDFDIILKPCAISIVTGKVFKDV